MAELSGTIFNVQRFSVHDGPGIRTTVFFKGCPLRCLWCHNPESFDPKPQVSFTAHLCRMCGRCVEACPTGAQQIHLVGEQLAAPETEIGAADLRIGRTEWAGAETGPSDAARIFDRAKCKLHGRCVEVCPHGALEWVGRHMELPEVMGQVIRDRPFYQRSGGGVTLSGGEPLAQPQFARALLEACKAEGLHTALDTSGYAPWERLEDVLPFTDLVLYDLKCFDPEQHRDLTGVDNECILANLRRLGDSGKPVHVRIPIVSGLTDSPRELREMACFLRSLRGVEKAELLPYNPLAESKHERYGRRYPLKGLRPPSDERMADLAAILVAEGLTVDFPGNSSEVQLPEAERGRVN